jgi:hypothetical protein
MIMKEGAMKEDEQVEWKGLKDSSAHVGSEEWDMCNEAMLMGS